MNLRILDTGLMKCGRVEWQEAEAARKDFNIPLDKKLFDLRALQGHSGRNPIDPSLQDNVLIPNNFFEYIYLIGCAVNLHSIRGSIFTRQCIDSRQLLRVHLSCRMLFQFTLHLKFRIDAGRTKF